MIALFARLFIKDYKNYSDVEVRRKYGILSGGVGIFLNIFLFVVKFIAGIITFSVSVTVDAFNNLSDAASSIVQILGFKLSAKKPDPEHPFGHGRVEYISGLIISFLILIMGVELFKNSVEAIIKPKEIDVNFAAFVILVVSILVKLYMMFYNLRIAKKVNSLAIKATGMDSLFDCVSTSLVLISFGLSKIASFPIDGITGILVSCFILYGGYSSAMETIGPLLGAAPSKELVEALEKEVENHPIIIGMHDLVVHDYGPGRLMISFHAEVPGDHDIFEVHDAIDVLEFQISQKLNCHVVIHMDPIDTKNEKLKELGQVLQQELKNMHPELKAHDIRMVPGPTHCNLIFDVVKPYSMKIKDDELILMIQKRMLEVYGNVFCVVTVDVPFV